MTGPIEAESRSQDFFSREEKVRNVKGEFVYFHIDEWHSSLKMTARRQIFDI